MHMYKFLLFVSHKMHIIWLYRIIYQIYADRITDWEIKKYEDPNIVHTGVSAQGLETEQS